MEHKETTKEKENLKLGVHNMKESSEKAIDINIELRVNVDEQQDDQIFKVKSDIDDSDEVKNNPSYHNPHEKIGLFV